MSSSDEDPSPMVNKKKPSKFEMEAKKPQSQKYSHLIHNRHSSYVPPTTEKPSQQKKKPPLKPKRPPLPDPGNAYDQLHQKLNRRPYDDVVEDKKLVLTPVARRQSSDQENDMWMAVKWQTMQSDRNDSISSSQRSSSQSALDQLGMVDTYTNVADIASGKVFVHQRRHSFTEGDSSIIITSPSTNQTSEMVNDDFDDQIYSVPPDADTGMDYSDIQEEDYVNAGAENMNPPTYENRDEVRQKFIDMQPAKVITNKLPPSNVKDMILESLRFKKPETVTIIQSSALMQSEKKQTLGMFNFSDSKTDKLQVGRGDYEQFALDAWTQGSSSPSSRSPTQSQALYINNTPSSRQNPIPPPPTRDPPARPPNRPPIPNKSPVSPSKPPLLNTPTSNEESVKNLRPPQSSSVSTSVLESTSESHDKSAAFSRPHLPLAQVRSQPQLPPNPSSGQPSTRSFYKKPMAPMAPPPNHGRSKPNPPPKPAPYQPPVCASGKKGEILVTEFLLDLI